MSESIANEFEAEAHAESRLTCTVSACDQFVKMAIERGSFFNKLSIRNTLGS